ncbi:uncharacterized protein LOC121051894 isoform X1 [Rosa chinensis]|uniref:uncharacterized protein LOC121051894 isoform X1 n=1 Tax=Rosa chinensis TaxID=74649 RepID=UPI001AD8AFCA|nr:uncharacterized protein LOC121051894 isoform X1 [Rosa chinensis]XP_040371434.1 uncharacterized protein LOC121051894 isoform X1 [Rosa chinensis]XP_040371438.1 uncharacterized protein LOC121051894 isoform X1 [Rosa chinensis]XP_040371439.1 uncharacterized protein LOC121051894 isoform X1 [Rosa chinensis]XP_040371440.1 uncharacterized protein LOC121051894 isoform X1 [Rosa chinensis]
MKNPVQTICCNNGCRGAQSTKVINSHLHVWAFPHKAAGKYPYFPGQEPTLPRDIDLLLQQVCRENNNHGSRRMLFTSICDDVKEKEPDPSIYLIVAKNLESLVCPIWSCSSKRACKKPVAAISEFILRYPGSS